MMAKAFCYVTGVAVLAGLALGASVAPAGADVVPGTEDGWGAPPGGVTLTVVDNGSGNHRLNVSWGAIDPVPDNGGYWQCEVNERSTTTKTVRQQNYTSEEPAVTVGFDVKLQPPSGGSYDRDVVEAPGERIKMSLRCYTVYPNAFPTTPPSPPFGWNFEYQLS